MVSFDTNILVYATTAAPQAKMNRARDLVARGMQAGGSILLLQTLAEFSNVAIRKAGLPAGDVLAIIDSWRTLLPVQDADIGDIAAALQVVKTHRLAFWDALLWASARRAGVRYLITEDMQDGFVLEDVMYVNPFRNENDGLIDETLPR